METIVARGNPLDSSAPIQEKGSNKRKFSAEPPIFDPNLFSDQMLSNLSHDTFTLGSYGHGNSNMFDMCTPTPWYSPKEEQLQEAEWNDIAESELEATLLRNVNMMFKSAIMKIMSHGYNEETAIVSILRTELCFGVKDTVLSIVDNALLFLKSGFEFDYVTREKLLEELNGRERSALNEMIGVVKQFRTKISRGEAMWRLLVSDMNVFYACSIGSTFPSGPRVGPEPKSCNSDIQVNPVSNSLRSHKPNFGLPLQENHVEKDVPNLFGVASLPNGSFSASVKESLPNGSFSALLHESLPDGSFSASITESSPNGCFSASIKESLPNGSFSALLNESLPDGSFSASVKESSTSLNCLVEENSSLFISQPKSYSGRRVHSGKRESTLHHKTVHSEKCCRSFRTKSTIRASKHSSINGVFIDRKTKTFSDPNNVLSMKDTLMKLNKSDVLPPKADVSLDSSLKDIANTELSLSLTSNSNNEICVSLDKLDEILQKLCIREKVMEAEMQEWTEWAQQKVMEAANRLGKDKLELQNLRLEKEEVSRLKKEKQSLENNTRKKLAEMEISLSKACAQMEKNNTEARKKERENVELRKALIAMKFQAAESAANYREISKKDLNDDKNVKFREREKALLREELVAKKKMASHLKQQLEQAKAHYDHLEARWKKQENVKQELLDQYNALRKKQEQIEISGRTKENEMRLKAETDLQRHKDEVQKLELQILQLRQKTDSSKIAALKNWSSDPKIYKLFEFQDEDDDEDVDREKECVMCLSEEMSVLFLPCAHQVVCEACNEVHQKKAMTDCPSCRTKIEKRVIVRSA